MSYKYLLTVSLLCLYSSSQCFASGKAPKDFDPDKEVQSKSSKKKPDVEVLNRYEIIDLTPSNPELLKLADQGNPEAMNRLGVCMMFGEDCKINKKKALAWFKKASEKNHASALFNYAEALFRGDGCEISPENTARAVTCLKKSVALGCKQAKYALAYRLLHADGFDVSDANQAEAWILFRELDAVGHADSTYMIAEGFLQDHCSLREKQEAVKYLIRAVKLGSVKALGRLGACYLLGDGCERDNNRAFECFKRAATQGHQPSKLDLINCLQFGFGVAKNPELALIYLTDLAEKGDVNAMLNLAFSHESGNGVEKNLQQARYWFEKSAESGDPTTVFQLALFYFNHGEYDLALPNFETIKEQYPVEEFLGFLYFKKKNYEQALECYKKVSEDDYKAASQSYLRERQVKVNPRLLTYLRKKVTEAKAVAPQLPKSETTNLAQKSAVEALDEALVSLNTDVAELRTQLVTKLDELKTNSEYQELNPSQELEILNKTYAMATANLESMDKPTRRTRLSKLAEFLASIEAKIMVFEHKLESDKRIIEMRKQPKNPTYEELESKQDRNVKKEVQAVAAQTLDDEKRQKHKKNTRKHDPLPKGKVIAKERETEDPKPVKPVGPFSTIEKFEKRTQADLTKTMKQKVYEIQNTLRDAESMDDAISLLKKLPYKHDFKEIPVDYAGCPEADIAFEMRIDDQYRVIIAFKKVYEESNGIENNNNAVQTIVYKLYKNKVYVDDPHIKG